MKKILILCAAVALIFVSCDQNKSEMKTLQTQNDSLQLVNAKFASELDEMLSLLNEVESNFQSIKSAENYVTIESAKSGEVTATTKDKIKENMQLITETLKKNKDQIANLEKKLKNSSVKSVQLQKTLEGLRNELNEKTMALVAIQEELVQKDVKISELSESIMTLSEDVKGLQSRTQEQANLIQEQKVALSTVYYCFGTSKELKDQKILVGGSLGTDFNRGYFIKVKDAKELKEIPLFAKKAKVISKHPNGSYEMVKDNTGNVVFKINDVNNFWSLTKYLVIQVN